MCPAGARSVFVRGAEVYSEHVVARLNCSLRAASCPRDVAGGPAVRRGAASSVGPTVVDAPVGRAKIFCDPP
eukprot:11158795-Lingulodinium_polyedra.AAC.1